MKKIKSLLLSVLSLMSLVGVAQPCTVLADETKSTDINISTEPATISVEVPTEVSVIFNADGTNTTPDNWKITNKSEVEIVLSSVELNSKNDWTICAGFSEPGELVNKKATYPDIMTNKSGPTGFALYDDFGPCNYTKATYVQSYGSNMGSMAKDESLTLSIDFVRGNFTSNIPSETAYTATLNFGYAD